MEVMVLELRSPLLPLLIIWIDALELLTLKVVHWIIPIMKLIRNLRDMLVSPLIWMLPTWNMPRLLKPSTKMFLVPSGQRYSSRILRTRALTALGNSMLRTSLPTWLRDNPTSPPGTLTTVSGQETLLLYSLHTQDGFIFPPIPSLSIMSFQDCKVNSQVTSTPLPTASRAH